jgi:hypothetical protein
MFDRAAAPWLQLHMWCIDDDDDDVDTTKMLLFSMLSS